MKNKMIKCSECNGEGWVDYIHTIVPPLVREQMICLECSGKGYLSKSEV